MSYWVFSENVTNGDIMNECTHLDTGEYKPKRYWEERAATSKGDIYKAVCAFGLSTAENLAMEKMQIATLKSVLHGVKLEDAKVLEFGCGVGRWAKSFLARVLHISALIYPGTCCRWRAKESRVPNFIG